MLRTLTALAIAALLLTGCEPAPNYSQPPEPTTPPIFESEEEAIEAGTKLMDAYVVAVTTLTASGGTDTAAVEPLVSEDQLADDIEVAEDFVADGLRLEGALNYFGLELQQLDQWEEGISYAQFYVCIDYRETFYVKTDGSRISGSNSATAYEALTQTVGTEKTLVLEEMRRWTGRDFCKLPG